MRLDPSRPSMDLDLADNGDPLSREMQIRDLEVVARVDLRDHFHFEIERDAIDTDEHRSTTVSVSSRIGGAVFERFDIDLAPFDAVTESEQAQLALPIDLQIPQPTIEVAIVKLEQQLADKICAMFERHGERRTYSSRWRDLADVAMIAMQCTGVNAASLCRHLDREVLRRATLLDDGLPPAFELSAAQILEWRPRWGSRGRTVSISLDDALAIATHFISPLLDGSAAGVWDCELVAWTTP